MANILKRLFKDNSLYALHKEGEYYTFSLSCAKHSLYILATKEDSIPYHHGSMVAVFTSKERLESYLKENSKSNYEHFEFKNTSITYDDLLETVKSNEVVFDPSSKYEFVLSEKAREYLLDNL